MCEMWRRAYIFVPYKPKEDYTERTISKAFKLYIAIKVCRVL